MATFQGDFLVEQYSLVNSSAGPDRQLALYDDAVENLEAMTPPPEAAELHGQWMALMRGFGDETRAFFAAVETGEDVASALEDFFAAVESLGHDALAIDLAFNQLIVTVLDTAETRPIADYVAAIAQLSAAAAPMIEGLFSALSTLMDDPDGSLLLVSGLAPQLAALGEEWTELEPPPEAAQLHQRQLDGLRETGSVFAELADALESGQEPSMGLVGRMLVLSEEAPQLAADWMYFRADLLTCVGAAVPADGGLDHYGDDPALDTVWDRCADGEYPVCDLLWRLAPMGSDYERFGGTCGGADPDNDDPATGVDCTSLHGVTLDLAAVQAECEQRDSISCDALLLFSAEGSPEQRVALTCGGRNEADDLRTTLPCLFRYEVARDGANAGACPVYRGIGCDGYVTDQAGVIEDDASLESAVASVVAAQANEIAVVVIFTSGDETPQAFAEGLGNTWGVGDPDRHDGVVVLIALEERRTEIVTGSGILGKPGLDEVAGSGDSSFADGDFDAGIAAILDALDAWLAIHD